MIIGNPSTLAIESEVTRWYAEPSQMGLGFFLIHLGGKSFGVRAADATLLACSFDEVKARLARRGTHVAPSSAESADEIACAYRRAYYEEARSDERFFGKTADELTDVMIDQKIVWAPDGDEAFDDGSFVLHFDQGDNVRLIGFKFADDPGSVDELSDVTVSAAEFYDVLSTWKAKFHEEWKSALARLS